MRFVVNGERDLAELALRARTRGALLAAVLVGGCSLQGLDDLTPPYTGCVDDADCEDLNTRDGVDSAQCQRWICLEAYCRLRRPGMLAETCDGRDEDCDGWIDEDGAPVDPVVVLAPADLGPLVETPARDEGALALFLEPRASELVRATVTGPEAPLTSTSAIATAVDELVSPTPGCGGASCMLEDASIAWIDGDLHVVAARDGLAPSRVRVGPVVDHDITLCGPDARSSIWRGITPVGSGEIESLVVAASPYDRDEIPQALVAWVGGSGVEAMGLWMERAPSGRRWAHGTGSGIPDVLPAAGTQLAVVALGRASSGFVLAYHADASELALAVVGGLPEPAPPCGPSPTAACITASGEGVLITQIPPTATAARGSAALEVRSVETIPLDASALALAARPASPGEPFEIALAFTTPEEVGVVRAVVEERVAIDLSRVHRVAAAGALDLSITRVERGLSTEVPGGYVLSWRSERGTYVARLPDATDEPRVSFVGDSLEHPRAFVGTSGLAVLGGDAGRGLVVLPHACGPRR